LIENADQKLLM